MSGALSITWDPLLPLALLIALAVAAAVVVGFALWRRARGAIWRGLAAAAVLGVLANPTVVREEREPLPDIALVAVDRSASQDIADRPAQTRKILDELDARWPKLANTEVRMIEAGGKQAETGRKGTQLFGDIERALSEIPADRLAGVVVVSDGQVHDVPDKASRLGIDAPVHLLMTGKPDEGDRRLTVSDVPSYGIVGKSVSVTVTVEDLPETDDRRTAELRIARDGGQPKRLRVPVGEPQVVEVPIDHRGRTVVEMSVAEGPRELTMANNRAAVAINGVRDRLRVLLVSGEPHPGERAWRHLLKSDPSVDLVHFTILRPPSKQDGTPINELSLIAFPTRELFEVKIDEFDLIVFDRYRRRGVLPQLYLANVAEYVRNGGALLEAGGPSFAKRMSLFRTPLGDVLPGAPTGDIFERAFRPEVSELGRRHPVTASLPKAGGPNANPQWGRWFRHIAARTRGGDVLMRGVNDRPLLVLQRVGEGRVAQLLSDHAWLWRRGYDGGGPQAELMRRVAHWLMKEPELEENDLRAEVRDGQLTITRRSLETGPKEVTLTRPDGSTETLTLDPTDPGRAKGRVKADEIGMYEVSDGDRTALAAAGALNPKEYRNVRASADKMRPLVAATGGGVAQYAADGVPRLRKVDPGRQRSGAGWFGLQDNDAYRVTGVARMPLLPPLVGLILVGGLILLAWFREAR